jgi:hypothetical protein
MYWLYWQISLLVTELINDVVTNMVIMPKHKKADETVLHYATSKSQGTLRVTIPAFIVSAMDLKKGDILRWESPTGKDGLIVAHIIRSDAT